MPLQLEDAARRPDVRTALLALDGVDARSPRKAQLFNQLHQLCGPHTTRRFAVLDLVFTFYTCDLTKGGVFRRNKRAL